jgi:glutathione S-transferase
MIRMTAYKWVPTAVHGLVRDLRVRWALEEAGLPYEVQLVERGPEQATAEFRAWQPYGQVPAYEEDGLTLFESGAIVLHIAEKSEALMPKTLRAQVLQWSLAALNSVEMATMLPMLMRFGGVPDGAPRDWALDFCRARLRDTAAVLKDRDYIVCERFTAADILMATVLSELRDTDLVEKEPGIAAYHARCLARPAYKKALADQLRTFAENAPTA